MRFFHFLTAFSCVLSIAASAEQAQPAMTLDELAVGDVQMVTCPGITEEFSQVLTRLDALKASIKKGANCKDVDTTITTKFDGITKTRDRFLELVKKSQTDKLTDSEIKEIGTYADQVTTKVGSIIDLMTNANNCFEEDADKKALSSLSGFVSEAATLLSQVAGPWGAPVAIGGQIVSGFISGLDKIIKARAGYDFNDRTQWVTYVQNLCTYHALRENVNSLLHPQDRVRALKTIAGKLDQNLATIQNVCPECTQAAGVPMQELSTDATVQAIDTKYASHLGSLAARVGNARAWIKNEMVRVSADSSAYWNNVTGKEALSTAERDLESFLIVKEAPKFLAFQYSQSVSQFQDLTSFLFEDGRTVLHQAFLAKMIDQEPPFNRGSIFWSWGTPSAPTNEVPVFQALTATDWRAKYKTLKKPTDDLGFRLISARASALDKFDAASWSFGTAYVFCDFFQQADLYRGPIQSSCSSAQAQSLSMVIAQIAPMTPDWQAVKSGIRTSDWTSALDQWSDQVQAAVSSSNSQLR